MSSLQTDQLREFIAKTLRPNKTLLRHIANDTQLTYQEVSRWFRNERHKSKKREVTQPAKRADESANDNDDVYNSNFETPPTYVTFGGEG